MPLKCPEKFRFTPAGYPPGDAQNGMFVVPLLHGQSVGRRFESYRTNQNLRMKSGT